MDMCRFNDRTDDRYERFEAALTRSLLHVISSSEEADEQGRAQEDDWRAGL